MIPQNYKNNVQESKGTITTTGFNIEINESMFQMLTSNVYNKPKLAVIREWSTNACDACLAAGNPVLFDVHLPTLEETYFSVRDYGTGLAPDDVIGLFSNLGASTKRGSNAYNGVFGIGRMAGLAVADAFTVDSYHNGTKHSYAISMQNGVPVTIHFGDSPTTEPNGLNLSVAVSIDDINTYKEHAENLYKYFDYKPKLNRKDVNVTLDVSERISDDWFFKKIEGYRGYTPNQVVMSQVVYDIPQTSEIDAHGFNGLIMKVPAGSVTFNPGRESLSLDKSTIAYINQCFENVCKEYLNRAETALSNGANDYEKGKIYKNLTRTTPYQLLREIDFKSCLSNYMQAFSDEKYNSLHVAPTPAFDTLTNNILSLSFKDSYRKNAKKLEDESITWDNFLFSNHVVVDLKSNFKTAISNHYNSKNLVYWQRQPGEDIEEAVKEAKKVLGIMGIPYTLASTLIPEDNGNTTTSKAPREGLYVCEVIRTNIYKSKSMSTEDATEGTYLFLKLKHTTPVLEDTDIEFYQYQFVYDLLKNIGSMPKVVGVPKKYQDYIHTLDNWVDYETYIKDKVKETTFVAARETSVPHIRSNLMNDTNRHEYPLALREFYDELQAYNEFNSGKNFIYDSGIKALVKKLGATISYYEPTKEIDLDYLAKMFPKSYAELIGDTYHYHMEADLVAYIATLEEFYAIHSS